MADLTDLLLYAAHGYHPIRELPDGTIIGVQRMLFTHGLFVGLTTSGYERRFCYPDRKSAELALMEWNGEGDPPGPWVKEKPGDRLGPGAIGDDRLDARR